VTAAPTLLTGWGRTAPTSATLRAPGSADELAALLGRPGERGVLARGLGRSYGDAAQNAGGLVLDMNAMSDIGAISRDAATAEAGVSLGRLMEALLPHGLFLPVTPGTKHVTLGGAIASDVHGKNHHVDGSLSRHVSSLVLQTTDGRRLRLTPEQDDFAATAGGMGLTGVILEATLRPIPVESAWIAETIERMPDLDAALSRMASTDSSHRYSVAWIDCLARGRKLGRSVLMRGDHAPAHALPSSRRRRPLKLPRRLPLAVPSRTPAGMLRRETVAAFNEVYFRRAPALAERLTPLDRFFHPLDSIADWNRAYGPRGLVQYQLVVPFGAEETLRAIVERLSNAAAPSFLGVLKRLGPERGLLSFPMPGWTLTADFPAGAPELGGLLDQLDEMVVSAGGRVYLAKDSRLRPELVAAMYPGLPRWREIQRRLDPEGRMRSDLARRLGLLGA
jgi:decaprenylphospho-beta-D-ribofuranose 2-oxidase